MLIRVQCRISKHNLKIVVTLVPVWPSVVLWDPPITVLDNFEAPPPTCHISWGWGLQTYVCRVQLARPRIWHFSHLWVTLTRGKHVGSRLRAPIAGRSDHKLLHGVSTAFNAIAIHIMHKNLPVTVTRSDYSQIITTEISFHATWALNSVAETFTMKNTPLHFRIFFIH